MIYSKDVQDSTVHRMKNNNNSSPTHEYRVSISHLVLHAHTSLYLLSQKRGLIISFIQPMFLSYPFTHNWCSQTQSRKKKHVWALHLLLNVTASTPSSYQSLQMFDWWVDQCGLMPLCICVSSMSICERLQYLGCRAPRGVRLISWQGNAVIECPGAGGWMWGHGERTLSISAKIALSLTINIMALLVLASVSVCVWVHTSALNKRIIVLSATESALNLFYCLYDVTTNHIAPLKRVYYNKGNPTSMALTQNPWNASLNDCFQH